MTGNQNQIKFDEYTSRPLHGYHTEPARQVPIVGDVDVLVVGGSQSGSAAAICAARHGAKVMLVERFGFLGGQSVYGLVTQWEKRAFINNLGAVATRGIAKEMLDRILAYGGSDGMWTEPPGCPEMRDGEEWLNIDAIMITLIDMCEEAGVELLFHTIAVDVMMDSNDGAVPKLSGVVFENKTGRFAIRAKVVIDATADLDLVWRAIGEEGCTLRPPSERQAAGNYVWYGGVDNDVYGEYIVSTEGLRGYPDPNQFPEKVLQHLNDEKLVLVGGFYEIMQEAEARGLLEPIRETLAAVGLENRYGLFMKYVGQGRWCSGVAGGQGLNLLDAWDVTRAEILRIRLTNMMLPVMRLLPGWENAYIDRTNMYFGSRESRYLKAVTMLREEDIFDPDAATKPTPPDTVGRSGAHDPGKNRLRVAYPIPYGMIVPEKLDGVLCCTRAVGAVPRVALDAHRGITPTIVVGQAAGTAAALAAAAGVEPREVDLEALQSALRQGDVVLDVETVSFDFEMPEDKIRPL